MGLSVDYKYNWYNLALNKNLFFNASMPAGPENHLNVLDDFYKGDYQNLIYLYHPNLWKLGMGYMKSKKNKQNIFKIYNWRTDLRSVSILYFKWLFKESAKIRMGYSIYPKINNQVYNINNNYTYLNFEKNKKIIDSQMTLLNQIFKRFKNVLILRTPIKEEIANRYIKNSKLDHLLNNYNQFWDYLNQTHQIIVLLFKN